MKALRVLLVSGIVLWLYAALTLTSTPAPAPPLRRCRCPRGYRCE